MNPNQQSPVPQPPQQPAPQQPVAQGPPQQQPQQPQQPQYPQQQQPQQQARAGSPYGRQAAAQPGQQQAGQQGMPLPPANQNSTQNTLEIAEIRDGLVIMADGSYRSIVMAQSINFDLMSPQEREAVEYSYQSFLNSLYFPVQILVRSQKVDLRPYIQKLEKLHNEQDNMLLAYLMDDYIGYIQVLAQETNIMDKQFYIVVPYFPEINTQAAVKAGKGVFSKLMGGGNKGQIFINEVDLEAAKTELRNRVQSILSSLIQLGVQAIPLDTQELIELYYDVYNPDTATHSGALSRLDLSAPIVRKGSGDANAPHLDSERNK